MQETWGIIVCSKCTKQTDIGYPVESGIYCERCYDKYVGLLKEIEEQETVESGAKEGE